MYKAIDLFAGIGGIRLGFEQAFGEDIKTIFVSEFDKNANKTYKANFSDDFEIAGDITQYPIETIPPFDICLAGFPCQAFSIAGKKMGFEDNYRGMSRGTLFHEVVKICDLHRPKVVFCENVKGLVTHNKKQTLAVISSAFRELGYQVFVKVLDSQHFGVPQKRERVYIVAFRSDIVCDNFEFPEGTDEKIVLRDIIEENPVSAKYYLSNAYLSCLRAHKERHQSIGHGFGYMVRDLDSIAGALVCGGMGRERNLIIDNRLNDFTPVSRIHGPINAEFIRKLTPRECARLQGFPDNFKLILSDGPCYKQLSNSVTVPVIAAIARNIKEVLDAQRE